MKNIISQYTTAMDELHILTDISYNTVDGEQVEDRISNIVDDVLTFLIFAYTLGIDHASAMLDYALTADLGKMEESIFLRIDGETFEDRVEAHVRDKHLPSLKNLVESEFHRVYNNALHDGAEEFRRREGVTVLKNWVTVRDDKVRATHDYLEGTTVAFTEDFYTFDGDHAPYPGRFARVENNANCRCIVRLSRT